MGKMVLVVDAKPKPKKQGKKSRKICGEDSKVANSGGGNLLPPRHIPTLPLPGIQLFPKFCHRLTR